MSRKRLLFCIALGGAMGLGLAIADVQLPTLDLFRLAMLVLAYFVNVIVHEAGHFVAARAMGYRLLSAGIAWFTVFREGQSLKFRITRRPVHEGFVSAYPIGIENLRKRHLIVVVAGPLASLLLFTASALLRAAAQGRVAAAAGAVMFWSGLTLVLTAIPFRSFKAMSDHAQIRILLANGEDANRMAANLALLSISIGGARPRDWPQTLVEGTGGQQERVSNRVLDQTARIFRYNWLLDTGRLDEAEQALVWHLKNPRTAALAALWHYEAAWFAALHREDRETARIWRAAVPAHANGESVRCAQLKADATLAWLEGRTSEAAELGRQATDACDLIADRGIAIAAKEALERVQ